MGVNFLRKNEVEKLLGGDRVFCNKLFKNVVGFIIAYDANNLSEDRAKDIAQDALVELILNLQKNKFRYESKLQTYANTIARNIYLMQQQQKKELLFVEETEVAERPNMDEVEINELFPLKWEAYLKELPNISKECRKMIKLIGNKQSHADIALRMGYKSANVVKNLIYRCKAKLVHLIESNLNDKNQINND